MASTGDRCVPYRQLRRHMAGVQRGARLALKRPARSNKNERRCVRAGVAAAASDVMRVAARLRGAAWLVCDSASRCAVSHGASCACAARACPAISPYSSVRAACLFRVLVHLVARLAACRHRAALLIYLLRSFVNPACFRHFLLSCRAVSSHSRQNDGISGELLLHIPALHERATRRAVAQLPVSCWLTFTTAAAFLAAQT